MIDDVDRIGLRTLIYAGISALMFGLWQHSTQAGAFMLCTLFCGIVLWRGKA